LLKVQGRTLENSRYRATLDEGGDLASLFDKQLGRELLSAPARLAFQHEKPGYWPAWNMDWKDRQKPPRGYVSGPTQMRVVEQGPVRVALEVWRETEGSRFVQTFRLSAGPAGDRLEVANLVDWKSSQASLKATFPLAAANPMATYNWDLGTLQRGNNDPKKYEVPSHGWFDLTDASGTFGVTVLTGAKYGSDKPDDRTLRLTLLYTPGVPQDYREQRWQDWGRHHFSYGLAGHGGDWRQAGAPWLAQRQDQPLAAFAVAKHAGALGRTFSLLRLSSPSIAIQAFKRAEEGEGFVVRLQELEGRPQRGVALQVAGAILAAEELDGLERKLGALQPDQGSLGLDFTPYQVRTLGLKVKAPAHLVAAKTTLLDLPFDLDAFSSNSNRMDGSFDGSFVSYPAEMVEDRIIAGGIPFQVGPRENGRKNALACSGQLIALPPGTTRVHLLVASSDGDQDAVFQAGATKSSVRIPHWTGYLGSWDNRVFKGRVEELTYSVNNDLERIDPAFLREGRPVWWASHHHAKGQDAIYEYAYLFAVQVEIPSGSKTLLLPKDPRIKLFAATASASASARPSPLQPLLPDLKRDAAYQARFDKP
jgi:alpha-mannosidase